jgi:TPR repeat protein
MQWRSSVVLLLLGISGHCFAASADTGATLSYEQAEDRAAFVISLRKARQGDSEAQWQVGHAYAHLGEDARALPMLVAAAASGHVAAASLAGSFFEDGRGGRKRVDEALRWYRVAAEKGEPSAMAALARLLPPGDSESLEFGRRAAEAGNADGQYQWGLLLADKGTPGDLEAAFGWLHKAASQGHVGAQVAVANHLLDGRGVRADAKSAISWLEGAAKARDPVANFLFGQMHLAGDKPDPDAARQFLKVAAMHGHREAQYLLGQLLSLLTASEQRREAVIWLEKAQHAGHVAAANRLGEILREDVGDPQHLARARELFSLAAERGSRDAMYNLALMNNVGLGGPRDTSAALKWFSRAADANHEKAIEVLEDLLGSSIKTSSLGMKGFWQR